MMRFSVRRRKELVRFLKFSVVGTIGAVVDFGTFNLLTSILGLQSLISSVISFTSAIISNFIWNRFWTYPDSRSKSIRQQALQFAIVNVVGLGIRTPIFAFSEGPLIRLAERVLPILPPNLPPAPDSFFPVEAVALGRNLALALAVIVVLFWNFLINRLWTYSDVS
jgi:putative flippase GtrA